MSDDREYIRQQRRLERERKEREFQEEMARYEAERQARLEARKKAREAENAAVSNVTASVATAGASSASISATSDASSTKRTLRRTETQKAIEANLDEWEEERKARLAEREREAQERKAALEAQLALEEKERREKAEARRKQRELEKQREAEEEAARQARLEARRREREAQRIAEEKEFEERQAARRKAREQRTDSLSTITATTTTTTRHRSSSNDQKEESSLKDKHQKDKRDRKDSKNSSGQNTSHSGDQASNNSLISSSEAAAAAKRALDSEILSEYESWASPSTSTTTTVTEASISVTESITIATTSHGSSIVSSSHSETLIISSTTTSSGSGSGTNSPLSSSLQLPRPESPPNFGETAHRRRKLGERGRASDAASRPVAATTMAAIDERKALEKKEREEAEKRRLEKEAEETARLKAAADAELAQQAEQDAKIREEMRKEEEALLAKEKAALEKAKESPRAPEAPAAAPGPAAASRLRSLLTQARQQHLGAKARISTTERPIAHVPAPITHRLTTMELFSVGGGGGAKRLPDPDLLMNHFAREGRLARDCVTEILLQIRTAFLYEKNVVTTKAPALIIGDIHGQFYDLLHLFRTTGLPGSGESNFVFLGDYVDRGTFSCEVCLILFVCKLRYPNKVTLLRGNHETRAMSSYHNFQQEATHKYGPAIYEMFMEVFDHLPLAAIVETGGSVGRIFCCHGGLSPAFKTIDEVQELERVSEPADEGAICDLIWADPVENDKFFNQNFSRNKERGCSVVFGYNPIYDFLEANNLSFIVRAHQVEEKGYRELHFSQAPPGRVHPLVITLFSAPNYCDSYENMAAYLSVGPDEYNFHQYTWQQHPYCLPDFSNAFKFSLPFIAENILKFLVNIVETIQTTDLDVEEADVAEDKEAEMTMDQKLRTVGRTFVALKKLRESSMSKLGNIIEQQKAQQEQQGSLVSGDTAAALQALRSRGGRRKVQRVVSDLSDIVKMASDRFKQAKDLDRDNERFHGRAVWKSTFRKLGRGVSFKV